MAFRFITARGSRYSPAVISPISPAKPFTCFDLYRRAPDDIDRKTITFINGGEFRVRFGIIFYSFLSIRPFLVSRDGLLRPSDGGRADGRIRMCSNPADASTSPPF